jgi:exoribonuclease-2
MGVAQYTWATSPLRRYADLVNQWQIIACARHGAMAALAAPFKPRDAALFAIVSGFDAAYAAYGDFQHAIERYWTLRWIEQNDCRELDATVMKEGLVRADTLPLVFRVPGTESFERGTHVRARVLDVDLLTLDLHARLLQRLEEPADEGGHVDEDDDEDGDAAQSGPLTLAIDLAEPPPGAEEAAAAPPIEPALPPGGAAAP